MRPSTVEIGGFAGTATMNVNGGDGNRDWNTNSGTGNISIFSNGTVNVGRSLQLSNNAAGSVTLTIDGGTVNVGESVGVIAALSSVSMPGSRAGK